MNKYTDTQLQSMARHLENIDKYGNIDSMRLNMFINLVAVRAKVSSQYVESKIREYSRII